MPTYTVTAPEGRLSSEQKPRMAAGVPESHVWAYIVDLPAAQMAEFGHVLPEPGEEATWTAALPATERDRMQSIGR